MSTIEYSITFSIPDNITGHIWETYVTARDEYLLTHKDNTIAMYCGALALIREGYVHVTTDYEPINKAIAEGSDPLTTNMDIIAIIVIRVAQPVTRTVNTPLSMLLKKLLLTDATQPSTQYLKPLDLEDT